MTKYIVTELGPIDRHAPGTDVTGLYSADVLQRLIDDGYIAEDKPRKRKAAAEPVQDETADEDND